MVEAEYMKSMAVVKIRTVKIKAKLVCEKMTRAVLLGGRKTRILKC
jgi:hypothetical protein